MWRDTAAMPEYGRLEGDVRTDVLVIGGGMAGILCAHFLRQAGVDCVLAEADRLCAGATGNTTAKITSQHGLVYDGLLRRFGALIRYVIAPILPDERDREDCLAEVLMRIWDGIGGYDPERGSWRAYITAAARNAALNRARAERVHTAGLPDGVSDQPGPEEAVIAAEEIDELRRAIDALPPGDRALIYRKYYYRQSTAQMASELGLTARAVEGRLYRIKKRLGAALGGERNG